MTTDRAARARRRGAEPADRSGTSPRHGWFPCPAGDRGSATVWVLAFGLVLVLAGMAGAAIGAARVARHQAKVAADLSALAGAMRAVEGTSAACARAAELAAANHARLIDCRVHGLDVVTTTTVHTTLLTGLSGTARATSRAGPVG